MKKMNDKLSNIKQYNWGRLFLELVVVFLGVTAGFLLNNWQMTNLDKQTEKNYKVSFSQDIGDNIAELEESVMLDSLWLNRSAPLLNIFVNDDISIDSAEAAIKMIVTFQRVSLNTSTYENITNSGQLNIITDYELREHLVDYYNIVKNVNTYNDYFFTFYRDISLKYILSSYSIAKAEFIDKEAFQLYEISNIFSLYYVMVKERVDAYNELLAKSHNLKDKLDLND